MKTGDLATHYATLGYRVLPLHSIRDGRCTCGNPECPSPGKHPRTQHGVKDASADGDTIREWWTRYPDANVGVAVPTGVLVLDIDPDKNGLHSIRGKHLPDGPCCRTGGGGWHYWFRLPDGVVAKNATGIMPGVDIRTDGGYVVAPPSRHQTGRYYEWEQPLVSPDELPPAPNWVLELLVRKNGTIKQAAVSVWREGTRHETALALAGALRKRGVPVEEAEALITAVAGEAGDPELEDRLRAVRDTYEKPLESIAGYSRLPEPLREAVRVDGDVADRLMGDILHYTNAEQFFRENFRRIAGSKTWLYWDGSRWRSTDDDTVVTAVMQHLSIQYADRFKAAVSRGSKDADEWLKLLQEASRTSRMKGVVEYAGGLPELQVSRAELDSDPWALNLLNGTLDLRTFTLREHRREDFITKLAPVNYDPNATSTAWDEHLNLCLPNHNIRRHLQRSLGKALVGAVLDEHLDIWYGADGANGKSTTARVVMKLLGDYARKAAPKLLVRSKHDRHPTEIADLAGARVVFSIEIDAGDQLNIALVKDLTGGDTLKGRFLYENFFEFSRTFSMFLLVNHLPVVESGDGGVWRRLTIVPWAQQIPEEKRRPQDDVVLELSTGENGSAVLNWMLAGLRDFMNDRTWMPDEVKIATTAYRYEQDPLLAFTEEMCEMHPRYQIAYSALYSAYKEWCYMNGQEPVSHHLFTRALLDRGVQKRKVGHDNTMTVFGIRLKPNTDMPSDADCNVDYAMRTDANQFSIKSHNSSSNETLRKLDSHWFAGSKEDYNSQTTPAQNSAPPPDSPVREGRTGWCGVCQTTTVHTPYRLVNGAVHWQCIGCGTVRQLEVPDG